MSKPKFAMLAEQFPEVFAMRSKDRQPLAIGIHDELLKVDTGLSANQLRHALASYCTSIGYLGQVQEGAARIGLDGQPAGVVTAAEAEDAAKRLATFMSGTAKQPVEALPQKPVGASKPVPAPPQKPVGPTKPVETPVEPAPIKNAPAAAVEPQIAKRRLGLGDLRAAAARRRQAAEAS